MRPVVASNKVNVACVVEDVSPAGIKDRERCEWCGKMGEIKGARACQLGGRGVKFMASWKGGTLVFSKDKNQEKKNRGGGGRYQNQIGGGRKKTRRCLRESEALWNRMKAGVPKLLAAKLRSKKGQSYVQKEPKKWASVGESETESHVEGHPKGVGERKCKQNTEQKKRFSIDIVEKGHKERDMGVNRRLKRGRGK